MRKRLKKSQRALKRSMVHLAIAAVSMGGAGMARAQSKPDVAPASSTTASKASPASTDDRFKDSIDAFVSADREHAPEQGGVLFVGSSTIRMWDTLAMQFSDLPIVRRGFGGSRMSDCTAYLDSLVTPHKPKLVVVYAGDNDLNEGATPQDVLASFKAFVAGVRKKLPETRIAYVSIKPSPSRPGIFASSKEANSMIKSYVESMPNLDYIDTFTAMLDASGKPRRELFKPDDLHMNDKGYALWQQIIAPHVSQSNERAPAVPVKPVTVDMKVKPAS